MSETVFELDCKGRVTLVAGRAVPHHTVQLAQAPEPALTLLPILPVLPSNDSKPCQPVDRNSLEPDPSLLDLAQGFDSQDWLDVQGDVSFPSFKDWPHAEFTKEP
jgi:hypothetical protein